MVHVVNGASVFEEVQSIVMTTKVCVEVVMCVQLMRLPTVLLYENAHVDARTLAGTPILCKLSVPKKLKLRQARNGAVTMGVAQTPASLPF